MKAIEKIIQILKSKNFLLLFVGIFITALISPYIAPLITDTYIKVGLIDSPKLQIEIKRDTDLEGHHREGSLRYYGMKWEDSYQIYTLKLKNNSNKYLIENIILKIHFPGSVIHHCGEEDSGADYSFGTFCNVILNEIGIKVKELPFVKITIPKLSPGISFHLQILVDGEGNLYSRYVELVIEEIANALADKEISETEEESISDILLTEDQEQKVSIIIESTEVDYVEWGKYKGRYEWIAFGQRKIKNFSDNIIDLPEKKIAAENSKIPLSLIKSAPYKDLEFLEWSSNTIIQISNSVQSISTEESDAMETLDTICTDLYDISVEKLGEISKFDISSDMIPCKNEFILFLEDLKWAGFYGKRVAKDINLEDLDSFEEYLSSAFMHADRFMELAEIYIDKFS